MTQHSITEPRDFFALIETYLGAEEQRCVRHAFEVARREHGDERRKSGELYFTHPLTVAYYLAEYQADAAALTAALLHDVAEDTDVAIEWIEAEFGDEVGRLVKGMTKFKAVTQGADGRRLSREEEQQGTLLRLFDVMTDDFRVGVIKLFDRLHNMRTIKATPYESQVRKAKETLAVYAPLANRFGLWRLRNELGAMALEILYHDAFFEVQQKLDRLFFDQQDDYLRISGEMQDRFAEAGLQVDIQPSRESIFSVFETARVNGTLQFQIDETLRVVVQVQDVPSCYVALGVVHQLWPPVPHKFDDYIARPRDNLYSALHTTVHHPSGQRVKVRFRTSAMNVLSEIGVLARWVHIGRPLWSAELAERVEALTLSIRENINLEGQHPGMGVQGVVEDVFRDQIVVYTPRGDVKQLPQGATALDFAYAIHTDVGHQCAAARVNGQHFPLNKPLHDGDRVFIEKRDHHTPKRTWLDEDLGYTATRYARANIRRWFRRLKRETVVEEGRALARQELAMIGLPDYPHKELVALLNYESLSDLYHDIGRAELLPSALATAVLTQNWFRIPSRDIGREVFTGQGLRYLIHNAGGRRLRLCGSCQPRPGDTILGFIRADGSVTVHKESCLQLPSDPLFGRTIKLDWGTDDVSRVRIVKIQVAVYDRPNLLLEIANFLADEKVNIHSISTPAEIDRKRILLELEVVTPRQVVRILHRIQALTNVFNVSCLSFVEPDDDLTVPFYAPE